MRHVKRQSSDPNHLSPTGHDCLQAAARHALAIYRAGWASSYAGPYFHTGTVESLVRRRWLALEGEGRIKKAVITPEGLKRLTQADASRAEEDAVFAGMSDWRYPGLTA